ncbi:hypothetical protein FGG08_002269 [Glutinoglossum americanum]|uniref:GED domain-containing protein n=1 Tax=Glutinoglossum americanum TaxID=1670608 RepID=A0A9P8L1V7_9PEZI|nr:hypothetical protein FGG08_002269 [Glutinoglossum americanum]
MASLSPVRGGHGKEQDDAKSPMMETHAPPMTGIQAPDFPERMKILEQIHEFRDLGVDEDIELPQLVVVGDQSSGKSSLMESITELPFPIANELCTRYATQIVFRHSHTKMPVKITILPEPGASDGRKAQLKSFNPQADDLNVETFKAILDEVKNFDSTQDQTDEDKEMIRNLVEKYIKSDRTIILAVMNGVNLFVNQEIFQMASKVDPGGDRTVGVITKLDIVPLGEEKVSLKIALDGLHGNLPWFCVRNRSTGDIGEGVTLDKRNDKERDFFQKTPWNQIPKDRVGVQALRDFLATLLSDRVRGVLPALRTEIQRKLEKSQQELDRLGDMRQDSEQQRRYLVGLAKEYQIKVNDALSGRNWVEGNHPAKLRVNIHNEDDKFKKEMQEKGHTHLFLPNKTLGGFSSGCAKCGTSGRDTDSSAGDSSTGDSSSGNLSTGGGTPDASDKSLNTSTYRWIAKRYKESRGGELLGLVNSTLVQSLFHEQTANWERISSQYIDGVIHQIHEFNHAIFDEICGDNNTSHKLRVYLKDHIKIPIEEGRRELEKLLSVERDGVLQTSSRSYMKNLQEARERRARNSPHIWVDDTEHGENSVKTFLTEAEQHAIYYIYDLLETFYEISCDRFMDNVRGQVVERILLSPGDPRMNRRLKVNPGPLGIFNTDFVYLMKEGELEAAAGEGLSTREQRKNLRRRVDRLTKALATFANA